MNGGDVALTDIDDLLPVGSIVRLRTEGTLLVITGVYKVYHPKGMSNELIYEYSAAVYPEGLGQGNLLYFNHKDIGDIIFIGMKTEEFLQYLVVIQERLKRLQQQGVFDPN